jgi:hypothetical protein
MNEDVDSDERIVTDALQELRNLDIQSDSPVVGKDLREIISKQMELSSALFERQHKDVHRQMKLNREFFERQHQDIEKMHSSVRLFAASALRLEKLTYALIGLTVLLGALELYSFLAH